MIRIITPLNQYEFVWVCSCSPEQHVARMDKDDIEIKCRKCKEVKTAKQLKADYDGRKQKARRDGWTGTGINRVWEDK